MEGGGRELTPRGLIVNQAESDLTQSIRAFPAFDPLSRLGHSIVDPRSEGNSDNRHRDHQSKHPEPDARELHGRDSIKLTEVDWPLSFPLDPSRSAGYPCQSSHLDVWRV